MKKRNALGIALVVLICILGIFEQRFEEARNQTAYKAAQSLCEVLLDYDFDGVSVDEQTGTVTLYTYEKEADSSSLLYKKEVAIIEPDVDQLNNFDAFKNVRCFLDGLFFVTAIGWDGEETGIYLNYSEIFSGYEEYAVEKIADGAYWLCEVPDHVVCESRIRHNR